MASLWDIGKWAVGKVKGDFIEGYEAVTETPKPENTGTVPEAAMETPKPTTDPPNDYRKRYKELADAVHAAADEDYEAEYYRRRADPIASVRRMGHSFGKMRSHIRSLEACISINPQKLVRAMYQTCLSGQPLSNAQSQLIEAYLADKNNDPEVLRQALGELDLEQP